ncbi:MAG: 3-phosphoserine/phosphohydroxythreonine transaminase [Gammaproteobacteria bacterium]
MAAKQAMFNFGAGPAQLPAAVMQQAQQELLDWHGTGISVIEMSHRSKHFAAIMQQGEQDLRQLLSIPEDYTILFLQGGATHAMSMLPLNLLRADESANYVNTGNWSGRAIREGRRLARVHIAASSEAQNFTTAPNPADWDVSADAAYIYYCDNETIGGVEYPSVPQPNTTAPLVTDMTSNFLSRHFDITAFGCVFAGAQKNIGPAGLTILIIRADLIGRSKATLPMLYDFTTYAENDSLYNTPATFSWYMAGLTFRWVLEQGGIDVMQENALARSRLLYDYIDSDDFYSNPVDKTYRSRMNVPFTLADAALDQTFLQQAADNGMLELRGHRSVGGMRASIYNGMPLDGVTTLVSFMQDFSHRHG